MPRPMPVRHGAETLGRLPMTDRLGWSRCDLRKRGASAVCSSADLKADVPIEAR